MNNLTLYSLREMLMVRLVPRAIELLNNTSEKVQNVILDDEQPLDLLLESYSALLQAPASKRKEIVGFNYLINPESILTSIDRAFPDEFEHDTVLEAIQYAMEEIKHVKH